MNPKKAIILFSGGLDSTTILAMLAAQGYECHLLSFEYGQNHLIELARAKSIATLYKAYHHEIIKIDIKPFAKSSLLGLGDIPKNNNLDHLEQKLVPSTYVPGRNTIFLSYAFAYAESFDINNIYIGCNALDYSNYPDCRPEYLKQFQLLINIAKGLTHSSIEIHAPLLHFTKSEIIMRGIELGVDYSNTLSCYSPSTEGLACGHCDSCLLRKKGFAQAGLKDPTIYSQLTEL